MLWSFEEAQTFFTLLTDERMQRELDSSTLNLNPIDILEEWGVTSWEGQKWIKEIP